MKEISPKFLAGICTFLILALTLSVRTFSQDYPAPPSVGNSTGLQPYGTFDGVRENISLGTGDLNLFIPILHLPGRNGLDFDIGLVYDSNIWSLHDTYVVYSNSHNLNWQRDPAPLWRLSVPSLTWQYAFEGIGSFSHGSIYCNTNFVLTTPDGSKHTFVNLRDCNDTNPPDSNIPPAVNISESADRSFIRLDTTNPNDIVAILKDGTRLHFTNYKTASSPIYPSSWIDTNGNEITSTTSSGNTTFTDTVGRQITIGASGAITYYDSNGKLQTIPAMTGTGSSGFVPIFPHPTPSECYLYAPGPGVSLGGPGGEVNNLAGTSSLTIPNGGSGLTYQFTYDGYGRIIKIIYPSGGYTRYDYSYFSPVRYIFGAGECSSLSIPYVSARHQCRSASGSCSTEDTTTYTQGTDGLDVVDATPAQNRTNYKFGYANWPGFAVLEEQRQYYSGQNNLLRTIATTYTNCLSAPAGYVNDCDLPFTVTTTLADVSPNLQGKVTYTYPSIAVPITVFGNFNNGVLPLDTPLTVTEYGYDGSIIRQTTNTWLNTGSYVESQLHILNRKLSTIVTDARTSNWSKTVYEYDNYTQGLASSGAVNHVAMTTARGNVTAVTQYQNQSTALPAMRFQYDDSGNIVSVTDSRGNTTSYSFADSWGDATCKPSTGATAAYKTNSRNVLAQNTASSYNSCTGSLASVKNQNDIDAARSGTSYKYDAVGRNMQTTSPDGGLTTICYTDAGGSTCSQGAPPFQLVTTRNGSPSPLSATTVFDGFGSVSQTQINSASPVVYTDTTYDPVGHVHSVSNPHFSSSSPTDGTQTYAYDALGRTTSVTEQDGSVVSTTYSGNCITVIDEAGKSRTPCSDALGRLTQVTEDPGSSPHLNYATSYIYDALDNLTGVIQGGLGQRTFVYDSLSRLTSATNPESGKVTYAYDPNGNLTSKTAPAPNQTGTAAVTTTYSYDALNRLTQKSYSDTTPTYANGTPTVLYGYDQSSILECSGTKFSIANSIGRMSWAAPVDQNAILITMHSFSYDALGRTTQYWQCPPAARNVKDQVVVYDYDLIGNPKDFFIAENQAISQGVVQNLTYDGAGRLTSFSENGFNDATHPPNLITGITYNALGQKTSATFANGLTQSWLYNKRGFVTSMAAGTGCSAGSCTTTKYGYTLGYAPNGNVTSANDTVNGNWSYSYDALNRLVCANLVSNGTCPTTGTPTYSYTYDRFGNRLHQTGPITFTFTGNNNRIDGYCYDAAGNLLDEAPCPTGSNPVHAFKYDAENRLVTSSLLGTKYIYDADGRRVEKATGTTLEDYLYDKDGNLISNWITNSPSYAEYYANGWHFMTEYVNAAHTAETEYFQHSDWLGTERMRSDINGNIAETCTSLPFGDGLNCTGATDVSPMHFTGKERDAESGLDNFGARYYASSDGRFMRPDDPNVDQDPADPQSWNLYTYVRNNPLRNTDPTGNACVSDDGKTYYDDSSGGQTCAQARDPKNNNTPSAVVTAPPPIGLPHLPMDALTMWRCPNCPAPPIPEEKDYYRGEIPIGPGEALRGFRVLADAAEELSAMAKLSGILREAAAGKGNFSLGTGTAAEAAEAGKAWVGSGAKVASDGKTLVSADGLRQYRPPSLKPNLGQTQANFEARPQPSGQWQSNGHLTIQ